MNRVSNRAAALAGATCFVTPAKAGATCFVTPAKAGAQFAALVVALLLSACAARPPSSETFTFAVLGDLGNNPREEALFLDTLRRIDGHAPAFVVHIGDFKGYGPCSDELYARRLAQFGTSASPLVYTPGDNEWTDCRRRGMGSMDPVERLRRLRGIFFSDGWSLGQRRIATAAQDQCLASPPPGCGCAAHPENRMWSHGRVQFVTLNIPGSNNNVGFDAASDEEARCRNAANEQWLERAARKGEREGVRALVVIAHANPWEARRGQVYHGFLAQMRALSARLRKPILFVHGDTHTYRVTDFHDQHGEPVPGITRLETHGTPFIGYVLVTADPGRTEPFSFAPRLVAFSLPR